MLTASAIIAYDCLFLGIGFLAVPGFHFVSWFLFAYALMFILLHFAYGERT